MYFISTLLCFLFRFHPLLVVGCLKHLPIILFLGDTCFPCLWEVPQCRFLQPQIRLYQPHANNYLDSSQGGPHSNNTIITIIPLLRWWTLKWWVDHSAIKGPLFIPFNRLFFHQMSTLEVQIVIWEVISYPEDRRLHQWDLQLMQRSSNPSRFPLTWSPQLLSAHFHPHHRLLHPIISHQFARKLTNPSPISRIHPAWIPDWCILTLLAIHIITRGTMSNRALVVQSWPPGPSETSTITYLAEGCVTWQPPPTFLPCPHPPFRFLPSPPPIPWLQPPLLPPPSHWQNITQPSDPSVCRR